MAAVFDAAVANDEEEEGQCCKARRWAMITMYRIILCTIHAISLLPYFIPTRVIDMVLLPIATW
eukprot:3325411-Ditylum_brightwellii.AAC.1